MIVITSQMQQPYYEYMHFPLLEVFAGHSPPIFYYAPYNQIPNPEPLENSLPSDNQSETDGDMHRRSRQTWTRQEDYDLLSLIKQLELSPDKPIPYSIIAKKFPNRSVKQIRQRYQNKLDTKILKTKFSQEEDRKILEFYRNNGPKWKQLSQRLKGRTAIGLRNRFNSKIKMQLIEDMNQHLNAL